MSKSRNIRKRNFRKAAAAPRPKWLFPAIVVGVGVALVGVVFALIQANRREPYIPEVTGGPSAAIDQEVFDYGDVHFNTPVETVFRVKNVGDEPLYILDEAQVEVVRGC